MQNPTTHTSYDWYNSQNKQFGIQIIDCVEMAND